MAEVYQNEKKNILGASNILNHKLHFTVQCLTMQSRVFSVYYIYDGIQAISDGKIGWSKFLVKNHPGPLRIHILIGLDPKNCLKFSKKVNFMIFKNLVKSTKAKMAISEILPFSGKIVIAAKRKGLKRSPICQN